LFTHSGDFKNFKAVIKSTEDIEQKKKYELILKCTYACIAVLIISFIATVALTVSQQLKS